MKITEPNPEKKKRAASDKRLLKLEKIGFELQAQRLRKEYSNRHLLGEMKMQSKSQKKMLTELPQGHVGNFLEPTRIISVTAHKWALYDFYSGKYIRGYRARDTHSMSVFSKLLVFCAVNTLVSKHKLDSSRFQTIVTSGMLKLHQGQSHLKADDIVSLQDLLHLMIMQESQLYETVLAVNVGAYLQKKRQKEYYSVFDNNDKFMKQHLKQFYDLVNAYCKLLKLDSIKYVEAEPVAKRQNNKCSAADIAVLSIQCMKIPLFNEILRKLYHTADVKFIDGDGKLVHSQVIIHSKAVLNKFIPYFSVCRNWEENNFMDSHCSIFYQNQKEDIRPAVIVLLGCYGPSDRQKDIQQVTEWYIKNKNHKESVENLEENILEPIAKKLSTSKLPSLKSSFKIQEKIDKKLALPGKEGASRYDEAIKYRNRSTRIKTTF